MLHDHTFDLQVSRRFGVALVVVKAKERSRPAARVSCDGIASCAWMMASRKSTQRRANCFRWPGHPWRGAINQDDGFLGECPFGPCPRRREPALDRSDWIGDGVG